MVTCTPKRARSPRRHFREALPAELGGTIGSTPHRSSAPADRRDLDEPARATLTEQRDRGLGHNDRTEQIGFDLCPELVDAYVLDRRDIAVAGIVDDDIEAIETADGPGDRAEGRVGIGHVERRGEDALASRRDEIGERIGVAGGRDQIVARRDDRLAESAAETARSAGNKPSARHYSLLRTKNKPTVARRLRNFARSLDPSENCARVSTAGWLAAASPEPY